jgi:hypothetical protein
MLSLKDRQRRCRLHITFLWKQGSHALRLRPSGRRQAFRLLADEEASDIPLGPWKKENP